MKAYISCPISVPSQNLELIINEVPVKYDVYYWNRKEKYNSDWLQSADVFIIVLPNNRFNYAIDELPIGVKRELKEAMLYNKKIFLAYRNTSGNICFYETHITSVLIEGKPGTTDKIYFYDKSVKGDNKTIIQEEMKEFIKSYQMNGLTYCDTLIQEMKKYPLPQNETFKSIDKRLLI